MPPEYPGYNPPPEYTEENPGDSLPGAVIEPPPDGPQRQETQFPLTPPPAYMTPINPPVPQRAPVATQLNIPEDPRIGVVAPAVATNNNRNQTLNLPSPVISERLLDSRQYMERFNNPQSRAETGTESRTDGQSRSETQIDIAVGSEDRNARDGGVAPDTRNRPPTREIDSETPLNRNFLGLLNRRKETALNARVSPVRTKREREPDSPINRNHLALLNRRREQQREIALNAANPPVNPDPPPVRTFSRPHQIITSLPPDEPEELAYI